MTLNISNHSIEFTYKMIGSDNTISDVVTYADAVGVIFGWDVVETKTTTWEVYADGTYVGLVRKAAGGWEGFTGEIWGDEKPEKVTYRTGPRKYAAEHLAYLAGLLDDDYNDINKETLT
tara:strand:+ start:277 stop:633 length:357 start_codon:yes stop_codon:yes gene_type:complete